MVELRTYSFPPGALAEYLRVYNEMGRAVQVEILGDLVGLYQAETGELNQLVFVWRFDSFEERARRRRILMADERFTAFRKATRSLLVKQESRLLSEA